jgi:nucleotide-binding universal stress UspA family protein
MRRLRNILVALDGSSSSFHALEESIPLAQWGKGGVTVITVAPPYEGDLSLVGVKNVKAAMEGPSEEILSRALEIAETRNASLKVICEEGEAHCKIIEHAEAQGSDLIVLGASNRNSLVRSFLGTIGSKVVEQSSRNVLVIPENAALGWEKILLASDGSECGQRSRELALELAVSYGGELTALFLESGFGNNEYVELLDEASEALRMRAAQSGVRCELIDAHGRTDRVVHNLARRHQVNLVVLGLQTRKRFWGLLPGSVTYSCICGSPSPVLVVKTRLG